MKSISGLSTTDFQGVFRTAFFKTVSQYLEIALHRLHYVSSLSGRRLTSERLQSSLIVSYSVNYPNASVAQSSSNVSNLLSSANFTASYQTNILSSSSSSNITSLVSGISVGLLQVTVLSSVPTRVPTFQVCQILLLLITLSFFLIANFNSNCCTLFVTRSANNSSSILG